MLLKLFGALFVVVACGSVGFKMATEHRKEENALRQLLEILDFLQCDLEFHLTPLPALCRKVSSTYNCLPAKVFLSLAQEMETQLLPNLSSCMLKSLNKYKQLPHRTKNCMELLGRSIGRFDLDGQRKGIEIVKSECKRELEQLGFNRENRLRSYQTLGLCAGAALAILFV